MTWAFFAKYVDETYAIADTPGSTAAARPPAGLTLAELEAADEGADGLAEASDGLL